MTTKITETDTVFALDIDEQPAPEPAAPVYDLDAPDSEWDGVPVTTVAMALDVLRSGRTLMTQCGPLQVTLEGEHVKGGHLVLTVWNTETCADVCTLLGMVDAYNYLHAYGHVADGAWHVHCPDEPDGAPLY